MKFRLYPVALHWWSLSDYGAVLSVVERLKAKRVLEFGPGSSTLALIEGGAAHIDACEDDAHYFAYYQEHLAAHFPDIVRMRAYVWDPILRVSDVDDQRYDLAFIDGPLQTPRRPLVVNYCLQRCAHVLVALECADGSRLMREASEDLASQYGRPIEIIETGPIAGAFGLIGPPC